MSKRMQSERSLMMNILPYERQDIVCVRPKQTGWTSTERSFR